MALLDANVNYMIKLFNGTQNSNILLNIAELNNCIDWMARDRPSPQNKKIESQSNQIRLDVVKCDFEKALEVILATEK